MRNSSKTQTPSIFGVNLGTAVSKSEKLSVAIDVTVDPATAGGIAQVILGLVHALGALRDGTEEYLLVVDSDAQVEYFRSFMGPNQRFAKKPARTFARRASDSLARAAKRVYPNHDSHHFPGHQVISDGFYEALECDVVHFPHQRFVICGLPSIFNPHDLQHLHFPQFFSAQQLLERDNLFRAGCHFSHAVAVSSQWVKEDVIHHYRIVPDKVQVIPWGPPTEAHPEPSEQEMAAVRETFNPDQPFALYPAMTWPHKNHVRLLEALARLRDDHGLVLPLVCTGSRLQPFWSTIEKRIADLNLGTQVQFTGFVSQVELRAIYRLARFLVMPTLFESDSSPIYEAWLEGLPVTCSNVTSLPAQTLDAARLFDPYDVGAIAQALLEMVRDDGLRKTLRARGLKRLKDYEWERTAKAYRALYRRALNRSLTNEDRWLLSWDWMQEPGKSMEASS